MLAPAPRGEDQAAARQQQAVAEHRTAQSQREAAASEAPSCPASPSAAGPSSAGASAAASAAAFAAEAAASCLPEAVASPCPIPGAQEAQTFQAAFLRQDPSGSCQPWARPCRQSSWAACRPAAGQAGPSPPRHRGPRSAAKAALSKAEAPEWPNPIPRHADGQAGQQGCENESASRDGRPAGEGCGYGCGCGCGFGCGCGCARLAADSSDLAASALGRARGQRCSRCACQRAFVVGRSKRTHPADLGASLPAAAVLLENLSVKRASPTKRPWIQEKFSELHQRGHARAFRHTCITVLACEAASAELNCTNA